MDRRQFLSVAAGALAAFVPTPAMAAPADVEDRSCDCASCRCNPSCWIKRHAAGRWVACHRKPTGPIYACVRLFERD